MEFLKAGEPVESNIFNQLDEKKRALIEKGVDVINLSIGTPDFQPDRHVMEAVSESRSRSGYVQVFADRDSRAARSR